MPYETTHSSFRSTSLKSIYKKKHPFNKPEPNSLMAFGFLVILFWILLFISKLIWVDMVINHNTRQINRIESKVMVDNEIAYHFLTKSGYQYYRNGAHGLALEELQLAHRIYPTRYEVNYITTITLIGICKQRGIYCLEAENSLNYLNQNWLLDNEWLEDQNMALGVQYFSDAIR